MVFFWLILGVAAVGLAIRPVLIWRRTAKIRQHWAMLRQEQPEKAVRIVIFGDSISEGVGATRSQYSYVSQIGEYVAEQTGRPVSVLNYSVSGATSDDVLADQLPKADLDNANLVLLEIGVNDSIKHRGDLTGFRRNFTQILSQLPLDKTVVADMPFVEFRRKHQAAVEEILNGIKVARAYPSRVFVHFLSLLSATAGDFWHPNDKGHAMWLEAFKPGVYEVLQRTELLKTTEK